MTIQDLAATIYDLAYALEREAALLAIEAVLVERIANRVCERCELPYNYGHARQRFCSDECRVAAWEGRSGKKVNKRKSVNGATGRIMGTSIYATKVNSTTIVVGTKP